MLKALFLFSSLFFSTILHAQTKVVVKRIQKSGDTEIIIAGELESFNCKTVTVNGDNIKYKKFCSIIISEEPNKELKEQLVFNNIRYKVAPINVEDYIEEPVNSIR